MYPHQRPGARLRQMLSGSPCWETDEACESSGALASVNNSVRGFLLGFFCFFSRRSGGGSAVPQYILRWKASLPSRVCLWASARVWTRARCAGRWRYGVTWPARLKRGGGVGGEGGGEQGGFFFSFFFLANFSPCCPVLLTFPNHFKTPDSFNPSNFAAERVWRWSSKATRAGTRPGVPAGLQGRSRCGSGSGGREGRLGTVGLLIRGG